MTGMIECAGWHENSCDDGPGIRCVLFFQGCSKNCRECHNSGIKDPGKGTMVPMDDLVEFIDENCCNKKITISGGEPLEQMEGLLALLGELKIRGYNVCLYTGWEMEQVPKQVLSMIDYIKTGGFNPKLKTPDMQYVGSSNQQMFSIRNGNVEEVNLVVEEETYEANDRFGKQEEECSR